MLAAMRSPCSKGLIVAVVASLAAAGCGLGEPEPDSGESSFAVRLLTSLPISGRWERAAEQGLGRMAAELGADVSRLRASSSTAQRQLVVDQGRAGVQLVFCVGKWILHLRLLK